MVCSRARATALLGSLDVEGARCPCGAKPDLPLEIAYLLLADVVIDARSDTHLYAEHYDRPLDDMFAIQSEVAKGIAD